MAFLNPVFSKLVRKELRKNQTDAESLFWRRIRNKQLYGLKFYRQYGIDRYILDFYCDSLKVAIELDGDYHAEESQQEYDQARTKFLEEKGIQVIRFSNKDIFENLEGVLESLTHFISSKPPLHKRGKGEFSYDPH